MKIALVACRAWPDLTASNACLAAALEERGAQVRTLLWNRDPYEAFLDADFCVLRQTWDYQDDPAGYAAWLSRAAGLGARIYAPPALAVWNNDKRTLREIAGPGVRIPKTVALAPGPIAPQIANIPGDVIVLKPAFGGSGAGVTKAARAGVEEALAEAALEAPGRPYMAQEFLPEIGEGEWKMTLIEGRVRLSVRARPRAGEFRINSQFNPDIALLPAPPEAVATAELIMERLGRPLCSRVDGIMQNGAFVCTELELTDPDLQLHRDPPVAGELAEAILAHAAEKRA